MQIPQNQNKIDFDSKIGQKVYIKNDGVKKKVSPKQGPFETTDVFTNGTVRIQSGHVNEQINIQRIEPKFE